jgi:hypothetical protein
MSEAVEIVASFPLPPKQFYENLSEEEILNMSPPPLPSKETETLVIFGNEQVSERQDFCINILIHFLDLEN